MTAKDGALASQPAHGSVIADVHWRPDRDTLVALVSYVLVVVALFVAFQVFTTERVAANFITFGPLTLAGLGIALPLLYTVLVRRRSLAGVGLTTSSFWASRSAPCSA
jgi:hypothetical protein